MEGIQISVTHAEANPEISIVKISGYIDTTTSGELERVIQNLLREQRFKIIIDLASVDYISSAGWGIFISEIKNLRSHRGDLKLANMSENVNEVYELLEFSTILNSASSVPAALKMFEVHPNGLAPDSGSVAKKTAAPAPKARPAAPVAPAMPIPKPVLSTPAPAAAPVRPAAPAMPVVSTLKVEPAAPAAAAPPSAKPTELPLIERIQAMVKRHPEWGAWKLKGELNRQRGTLPKVSWGEVRAELKYSGLSSKEKRFTFARKK